MYVTIFSITDVVIVCLASGNADVIRHANNNKAYQKSEPAAWQQFN